MIKVIRLFLPNSAGGPDGVRSQHIVDMINSNDCSFYLFYELCQHAFRWQISSFCGNLIFCQQSYGIGEKV